ncbi:MAG TPA: serine/threonine-protein kinase [Polyangiaceae bacterium]|nr:serine/threonine-protein kinase [Polyangiaceae bacterium]
MTLANSLRPGYRLGRYECLVPLGQGGMAAVWAARVRGARGFQKVVALKVMLPTLVDDNQRDHEAMFYDEARIASQIRHPNVVETFDLGEEDGSLFIAMELLEGESLSQLCHLAPSGLLPLPAALRAAIDACAGLHAAHTLTDEQGTPLTVVHRDVTPHNLFVTRHGVTKVTDFGIAKAFGKSSQETRTGVLKGKIAYMAPEQLGNTRPVDARSDIFSLGVSIYQMTTGVHPFHAQTLGETVARVLGNALEPPSRAVGWRYPPGLEAVLMRALAPDPDARFPSAEAFGEALDAVGRREVGLASARDVSSLLEVTAGASLRKRSEALRQALEMAKARADQSVEIGALATVPAGLLSPPTAPPTPTPTPSNNVAPVDLGSKVSFHRSLVVSLPPPKRRWPVAAFVGVGLLAPAFGATAAHFWAGPAVLKPLPAARGAASATALGARPAPAADKPEGTAAFVAPPEGAPPSSSPPSAAPREASGKEAGRDATKPPPKAPPPPPRRNGAGRPGEAPANPGGGAVPVRDPGF